MTRPDAVAVLDIGKSNVKLAVLDRASHAVLALATMKNQVLGGPPYPHFDVDAIWSFFIAGLSDAAALATISVIAVTTHGAAVALLGEEGLALPVLDYEHGGPDAIAEDYRAARGPFAEILSPDLPGGLNVGRQLYWQSRRFPDAFASARSLVGYPQYWVWRLTGARVAEPTAFGAHTDLWNAKAGDWSTLAKREGWAALVPPRIAPWDAAGTVLPEIADAARLPADCRVVAGIHDSNASLLPHILGREPPFAVLSTGTWMITFAAGGSLDRLDPARGGLAYVDAFGRPVPSTMSMTGREFELLTAGERTEPSAADVERVLAEGIMALPGFTPGSGPFGSRTGSWSHAPATLTAGERAAVAALYAALVAEVSLQLAGAEGPVLVEGPFARNPLFLAALAARVPRPVIGRPDATGTTEGAALLAEGPASRHAAPADPPPATPLGDLFADYAARWHRAVLSG